MKKNGVFLSGISFFVIEIFAFLYYANEESDDVIDGSTVPLKQYNTQSTISLEILEQCSSNLAPEMCITKGREWHLLSCCCEKPNIAISNPLR